MTQYAFQEGLIVVLVSRFVVLFEEPDRAEKLKNKAGGGGEGEVGRRYFSIYFMFYTLSLTFWGQAAMEALVACG